ncbi:LacI family transcriptional regulator [Asaia sp. W19]|uniref:LacI family DNA-binding transcriptional regulator n=1 Tax=unclassified Asaia TaxID=2685023 RepID=UPI000F8ECBF7|nr:LacI family DNA-binding transcriptional regulator [Asaia sp. W19]RUT24396.1 LacI family transcriptional regulator [Asaia sp. W19]
MTKRVITSIDVARLAGVSQSAVSRAFSTTASISPATREKVLKAADTLNYKPNRIPSIMLTGRSGMIGIIVGGLRNPLYGSALEQLSAGIREAGFQVLLVQVMDTVTLEMALDTLAGYRVDALITALAIGSEDTAAALSTLNIPVICFNSALIGPGISSVRSNNFESGRRVAALMQQWGVERPYWLAGPVVNAASRARRAGFLEGWSAERSSVTELQGDDHYDSAFSAVSEALRAGHRPDGLFCSNDLMGCGALDALKDTGGMSCPEDVVVIGYDNIPQSAWHSYQLSSFDQRPDALVAASLDILARSLSVPDERLSETHVIEADLVLRRSTSRMITP